MARRFVDSLADGDNVDEVFLVIDKQLRANRNGNLYLQVDLGDRSGHINGRMWNAGEPLFRSFENGDFLSVKGKVQLFQGSLQLILNGFDKVESNRVELTDFLPHTKHDIGKLLDRLKTAVRKVGNPHLKALGEVYFIDPEFMQNFCRCPAGVKVHHAYVGGLLEHVVTMMDVAEKILPLYPEVSRDLLVMGVFLHDSGKVRELSYARNFTYSDEGQLLGHLALGIEMLADKARQVPDLTGEPFPAELLLRLKHLILSHHGDPQFGSPKVPMTPEAVALHAIDLLDSRIHIAVREISEDRGESAWTPWNAAMGRRLYKGGRSPSSGDEEE
ncbi:MAG TPA: HD domain-containing protein [Gemmataceae bacterium]|jgi:3'-5' exoribonuclease|nr:HD domain-containing protein [Gemmataceae bacterium]